MTIDGFAQKQDGSWQQQPCDLQIEAIEAYGQAIEQIDQTMSARLTVSGTVPVGVVGGVLICATEPSDWTLTPNESTGGHLWVRDPA